MGIRQWEFLTGEKFHLEVGQLRSQLRHQPLSLPVPLLGRMATPLHRFGAAPGMEDLLARVRGLRTPQAGEL